MFTCECCGKKLKSQRGMTQHTLKSWACREANRARSSLSQGAAPMVCEPTVGAGEEDPRGPVDMPRRQSKRLRKAAEQEMEEDEETGEMEEESDAYDSEEEDDGPPEMQDGSSVGSVESLESDGEPPMWYGDQGDGEDEDSGGEDDSSVELEPDTTMRDSFREYCDTHSDQFDPLDEATEKSIRLMDLMRKAKCPLNAYQPFLEWHLRESGHLADRSMTLKDTTEYVTRPTLMKRLFKRYGCEGLKPKVRKVKLPHSNTVVSIPCRDAKEVIKALLTDPRTNPEDYLFFDNNPWAPPPDPVVHLADLNTGDAYLKSHEALVKNKGDWLLPVVLYMDAAVTGQFSDLPVTPLKIALGCHNQKYRDKEHAWMELAWIPKVRPPKSRGRKIFKSSGHIEAEGLVLVQGEGDSEEDGTDEEDPEPDTDEEADENVVKAQDLHTMLSVALESFVDVQRTGFMWDLVHEETEYKNSRAIIYVSHLKVDNDEADKAYTKYEVRTGNVAQLCRTCYCPTCECDDPRKTWRFKKPKDIQKLVDKGDLKRLKAMSQHCVDNAFYALRFHLANDRGIHGACPCDKLHTVLLGIFKYTSKAFFERVGPKSQLAKDLHALGALYGSFFQRQSDRTLPNTQFGQGLQKGKLMAKEHRGVLLVLAIACVCTAGRKLLGRRKAFSEGDGSANWSKLLEMLLQWEAFLCLKEITRADAKRLDTKHKFIMYLLHKYGRRKEGMGLKVYKFHAMKHMVQDFLLYGTASEMDTGSNESHHKPSKYAARLTQRKESTFNLQTANRMTEFHVLDLALTEVEHKRTIWEYFELAQRTVDALWEANSAGPDGVGGGTNVAPEDIDDLCLELRDVTFPESDDSSEESEIDNAESEDSNAEPEDVGADEEENSLDDGMEDTEVFTGGTRIRVYEDHKKDYEPCFEMMTRSKRMQKETIMKLDILTFLNDLQNLTLKYLPGHQLSIKTEHKRNGVMFRGHPKFRGDGPWRDWATIDWGKTEGKLPCHIWCFVELRNMPTGEETLEYGGIDLQDGVFAVVEVAKYNKESEDTRDQCTDLFTPLKLIMKDSEQEIAERKFYLAETEAIVGTSIVVPDVGGARNAFLEVKPREQWAKQFLRWLRKPHKEDKMDWSYFEEMRKQEAEARRKKAEKAAAKRAATEARRKAAREAKGTSRK